MFDVFVHHETERLPPFFSLPKIFALVPNIFSHT
jgi:hypothetical protein